MNHNEQRGPWESTPGLVVRMVELYALTGDRYLSASALAEQLNAEFHTDLTRNAIIGRAHRMNLPVRRGLFVRKRKEVRPKMVKLRPRVDAPIPPVLSPPGGGGDVSIYQLRDGVCRWPLGEMTDWPPFRYCGHDAEIGVPYCPEHCEKAYGRGLR
jgi:GcrA cell cycle regulator